MNDRFGGMVMTEDKAMYLQTWAEWVHQIDVLTGGGEVMLLAGPHGGMTIAVQWRQDGRRMRYGQALSMHEIEDMGEEQSCVLEQITNEVRKMTKGG
jgi:hypothetical protein